MSKERQTMHLCVVNEVREVSKIRRMSLRSILNVSAETNWQATARQLPHMGIRYIRMLYFFL